MTDLPTSHLVLDVNGTLSDLSPLGGVLARHGAAPELARTWFAGVLRDGFALSIHRDAPAFLDLAREVLLGALASETGLDAPGDEVAAEVMEELGRLGVHPDVEPGLRALAAAGVELTAYSNGSAETVGGLLARAGLSDVVPRVLSVEQTRVWKPHPAAYAYATEVLGRRADELTLVAVHPWDLDGAAHAGWRTVWVDRTGSPWPSCFQPPDVRATSFTDLAGGRV